MYTKLEDEQSEEWFAEYKDIKNISLEEQSDESFENDFLGFEQVEKFQITKPSKKTNLQVS